MTTDVWGKVMGILISHPDISMNELHRRFGHWNKTRLFQYLNEWEKEGLIVMEKVGREKRISLSSPDKKIDRFIKDFGKELDNYEKLLNKHLITLKKNKPFISPKQPMKPVKTKVGVLELDKKDGVYRDLGKTENSYSYKWNCRTKPLMHFESILNLLSKLYQESSVTTFDIPLLDDFKLMKDYQAKSHKLIEHTVKELENMFRDDIGFHFIITRIRTVLYGLVYRATMEAKMKNP